MMTAAGHARELLLALLAARAVEATVCPSEVARAMAKSETVAGDWRSLMPTVHSAVDDLMAEGMVGLSWKGVALTERSGPYRIRLKVPEDEADVGSSGRRR